MENENKVVEETTEAVAVEEGSQADTDTEEDAA